MGVSSMASGRKPSMLRMSTRDGRAIVVAVGSMTTTGVTVTVGGWKGVGVTVYTGTDVGVGSGVETRGRHEVRKRSVRVKVRARLITNLSVDF